eukprot:GHVU01180339.1.p1 GENE.GHVU01180339.1~~GHVU01180339.1.p1  ORF type:complete len:706 (+),score=51.89 GHVU01180339.1:156-2273(+)
MQSSKKVLKYHAMGLSPIPLVPGKKRPVERIWQEYCKTPAPMDKVKEWENKYDLSHVGLCLGIEVKPKLFLVAVDVDDDDLVAPVYGAVGSKDSPAKIGKKGVTIFCLASNKVINQKIRRKNKDGKVANAPSVEILCAGSQTVVPPSIHPQTTKPYRWKVSIEKNYPDNLAIIDEWTIDEIVAICQSKDDKIVALNEMNWMGPDGGGNTHDCCLEAVAWMVSRGWPDNPIHARIERAKREACNRAGDEYNWSNSSRTIQGWIDSAREKGMTNSSKKRARKPKERAMAEWLINEFGGDANLACVDGVLRYYQDGHWPQLDVQDAKRNMYLFNDTLKKADVENAVSIVSTLTSRKLFGRTEGALSKDDTKRRRICLNNGTFNINTMELERYDKEHELCFQLGFDWADDAECPLFNKFMEELTGGCEQTITLLNEFAGLTLVPDTSFQKFLVLKGPGGNGKGTWTNVIRSVHDPSAVGSVGITDLDDERKRTSLVGKLLNISGEQSRMNLIADTVLKKITGEDPVDVRKLYRETQNNVIMDTRFIETLNEMPQTSDTSDALRRRMILISCNYKVVAPDIYLKERLMAERPGIFRLWVNSLKNLYKRGHFDIPSASHEEVDDYLSSNSPVMLWLKERCVEVSEGEDGDASNDLYLDFREWAKMNGYTKPFTNVFWGQKMTSMGYPSMVKRVDKSVKRVRGVKVNYTSRF